MTTGNAAAVEHGQLEITFVVAPVRGVSEALSLAADLYLRNLRVIFLVEAPLTAFRIFLFDEYLEPFLISANLAVVFLFTLVYALCFEALTFPTIIFSAVRSLATGKGASISAAVAWGVKKWLPTLLYLGLTVCIINLGMVLLIVPGIIAAAALSLVGPVVAIEGVKRENPLVRSRDLTEGRLMLILKALAVCFAAGVAISFVGDFVTQLGVVWDAGFVVLRAVASHFLTMLCLVFYLDSPKRERIGEAAVPREAPTVQS